MNVPVIHALLAAQLLIGTAWSADDLPKNLPLRADQLPKPKLRLVGKAIKPSVAEVTANPRARSAVMRVAEKL